MNSIDLKQKVAAAVAVRWDEFATRHPNLAGVIDQTMLVENAAAAIADDPAYQAALSNARAVNAGLETLVSVIDRAVTAFIGKLIA